MLPDSPEILPIFLSEFLLIIFLCCYLFLHFFFLAFGILFEFHWFVWLIIWIWFSQPLQMLTYPITIHFKKGSLHHFCLNKGILKESLHRTLKTICIIYILKDSFGFFKSFGLNKDSWKFPLGLLKDSSAILWNSLPRMKSFGFIWRLFWMLLFAVDESSEGVFCYSFELNGLIQRGRGIVRRDDQEILRETERFIQILLRFFRILEINGGSVYIGNSFLSGLRIFEMIWNYGKQG